MNAIFAVVFVFLGGVLPNAMPAGQWFMAAAVVYALLAIAWRKEGK